MNKHLPMRSRFHRNSDDLNGKTNWLKAAVLGSNDGIISISGLIIGVAGATDSKTAILTAGFAGITAGALSIAVGEYMSVSLQRDSENTLLANEKHELRIHPKEELNDLVSAYVSDGLSVNEAEVVARELTKANALAAHADADYHLDTKHLTNPWSSVFASAGSFIVGAFIPLIFILLPPQEYAVKFVFVSVIIALTATGIISAKMSGVSAIKPTLRIVIGGAAAMIITYMLGNIIRIAGG